MEYKLDYEKLGLRIKAARESKNMTQEQLCELANLSSNFLSNVERAKRTPSLETIVKICSILDVTTDHILSDSVITSDTVNADIANKLSKCNNKSLEIISQFIDLMIKEQ